jgi:TolA-binding protein
MRKLEAGPAAAAPATDPAPAPPVANVANAPPAAAPAAAPILPASANEQKSYDAALDQFKRGDYQGAITGFTAFVKTNPKSAHV